MVSVDQKKQVAQIDVGLRPRGIAFTPDGKKAFVASELVDTLYAIDVQTLKVIGKVNISLKADEYFFSKYSQCSSLPTNTTFM